MKPDNKRIYESRHFYHTEFTPVKKNVVMEKPSEYIFFEIFKDKNNYISTRADYRCMICKHIEKDVLNSEKETRGMKITFRTQCKKCKTILQACVFSKSELLER